MTPVARCVAKRHATPIGLRARVHYGGEYRAPVS
jgi:hypothetical protein